MWKVLKKIIGNEEVNDIPEGIHFDGGMCNDPRIISNNFNSFFLNSVQDIIDGIGTEDGEENSSNEQNEYENIKMDRFEKVTYGDVNKIITKLDVKKDSKKGITVR